MYKYLLIILLLIPSTSHAISGAIPVKIIIASFSNTINTRTDESAINTARNTASKWQSYSYGKMWLVNENGLPLLLDTPNIIRVTLDIPFTCNALTISDSLTRWRGSIPTIREIVFLSSSSKGSCSTSWTVSRAMLIFNDNSLSHEFGHTLFLIHTLSYPDFNLSQFDLMGRGNLLAGPGRQFEGWIYSSLINEPGDYHIKPIESMNDELKLIHVNNNNQFIRTSIEYHQGRGIVLFGWEDSFAFNFYSLNSSYLQPGNIVTINNQWDLGIVSFNSNEAIIRIAPIGTVSLPPPTSCGTKSNPCPPPSGTK